MDTVRKDRYDFIVCGAGAAGSVLAARLSENESVTVLLLEAGPVDDDKAIEDPNGWRTLIGSKYDWKFRAAPSAELNWRELDYSMGRGLGGSSNINVCTWMRGHKADWDFCAQVTGEQAWNYEAVQSLYANRIESRALASPENGREQGLLRVQQVPEPHPFSLAFLEAAESVGVRRFEDSSGALLQESAGCALIDENVFEGRRQSVFQSYLGEAKDRANLTVSAGCELQRLTSRNSRITGVEIIHESQTRFITAEREVILSLGAVNTPKVLMQSGVGRGDELTPLGIKVIADLPGVGQNLCDHSAIACIWKGSEKPLLASPRPQSLAFWNAEENADFPNVFVAPLGVPTPTPENASWLGVPKPSWTLRLGIANSSAGSIHIRDNNPQSHAIINTSYLTNAADMNDLILALERVREIGEAPSLREYGRGQVQPGNLRGSELERFIRNGLVSFHHPCGTAKMGTDAASVVDGQLKVHGIDGLRLADASVLPRITRGPTMAPCVVIGERAAEMLKREYKC